MAKDLIKDLRFKFSMQQEGKANPVENLPAGYEAWVVYIDGKIGVAVPCKINEPFIAEFSKIYIEYMPEIQLEGKKRSLLFLYMKYPKKEISILNSFASICAEFVDPGNNGEIRRMLEENPFEWWNRWKELMGNAISEKKVYDVLGELLVYDYLLKNGHKPEWTGARMRRVDFVTERENFEVKSSINRYETEITVHGQLQLLIEEEKQLNLMFCRFEESPSGISINEAIEKLIAKGIDKDVLEDELESLGYAEGYSVRNEKYALLELKQYKVDENFPRIVPESFKDGKMPDGIKRIEYSVDLANLKYDLCELSD